MDQEMTQQSESLQQTGKWRRRAGLLVLSELGLVVVSVAIFFVFLTALTRFYFPIGSTLSSDVNLVAGTSLQEGGDVTLDVRTDAALIERLLAGEIMGIQRRVQRRAGNSLTWSTANVGDTLVENDAVQTFARSTAVLKVNEQSRITIGQNSLIVFDRGEADPFVADRGSTLVMIDGELSGSLTSDDGSPLQLGVTLPNSEVTLTRYANDDVEFLITVNDDQTTTVNLHGGSAFIVGRDGRRTPIKANQSATVDSSGALLALTTLPPAPRSKGPADRKTVTYRNVPEPVDFRWNPVADADRYHIVVARDANFSDRVVDDDVIGNTFRHGAMGPGTYYWYVRSRVGWSQSKMSAVRRLDVFQDIVPPRLVLQSAPAVVAAGKWQLHGRTDSGATVFIDDAPISHVNGRIDHAITLKPGANIIVVRAMDAAGNLNYESISVNAK